MPWERRGKRMDECMDILRGLTSRRASSATTASSTQFPPLKQCPAPTEPIPLLVGGHSDAALRRAVLKGDGWMHAGGDGEELDRLLARLAEIRKAEGDTRDDFEVHVISYDAYDLDGVKRLEDKGVTDCIVGLPGALHQGPGHRAAREEGRSTSSSTPRTIIAKVELGERPDRVGVDRADLTTFTDAVAEAEELIRNAAVQSRPSRTSPRATTTSPAGSASSLQMAFDYDLEHPVLINPTHQYARQGLDNPDALYFNAYLDGDAEYVVRGRARHHRRPVLPGDGRDLLAPSGAPASLAAFDDRELEVADGRHASSGGSGRSSGCEEPR